MGNPKDKNLWIILKVTKAGSTYAESRVCARNGVSASVLTTVHFLLNRQFSLHYKGAMFQK